ncbi:MAG: hypothetical protein CMJ72_08960 [Planctomycetaceae bacterium]|nr:hypothetical protein [Planctomycetaceae bacterium]
MATLEFVRTELVRKREKGEESNRALMPFGMSAQGGSNRAGIRASISCSRIRQDSGGQANRQGPEVWRHLLRQE